MNSVSSAAPSVAPPNPLPLIADLLTVLPLGSWMWVAVAIAALAVTAYATRQRTPITTLADLHDEIDEARR